MSKARRDAPSWKLATLYEGVMRYACPRQRVNTDHRKVPCRKCGVFFVHNTERYWASHAEIVAAHDEKQA